jgi:hypothetical protein
MLAPRIRGASLRSIQLIPNLAGTGLACADQSHRNDIRMPQV